MLISFIRKCRVMFISQIWQYLVQASTLAFQKNQNLHFLDRYFLWLFAYKFAVDPFSSELYRMQTLREANTAKDSREDTYCQLMWNQLNPRAVKIQEITVKNQIEEIIDGTPVFLNFVFFFGHCTEWPRIYWRVNN